MTRNNSRGLSKADWLKAALSMLPATGIAGLSVEGLAHSLAIAKSGFYWHFENREELLNELLNYWIEETTEVITKNSEISGLNPRKRLSVTAEMILIHNLARHDMAIRQWAIEDKKAAAAVRRVDRLRLGFIRNAIHELGFAGDDLEMRAMLFFCYHTWEGQMFPRMTQKRRRSLIERRIDLLTSKSAPQ